jgi:hypothetical protein
MDLHNVKYFEYLIGNKSHTIYPKEIFDKYKQTW